MKYPQILAPAGDRQSFLAAIAAGADAIYCGLKIFSARMEAANFSIDELSRLTDLAEKHKVEVYLALNSIIKESEIEKTFKLLCKLVHYTKVKGLIIQDPAILILAEQAGFENEFHLSTLGNCTSPSGILTADRLGFSKVVLPREFNIDEIKTMADNLPGAVDLETFIHGALCYSVSGRCYWSSWFGGKSSLRGRCVQPCRRIYDQKGARKRHFSCMDFSADVLAKVLKDIPNLTTWKIEGRKKSPHYVYYTVKAYKLLRDDPKQKKQALAFLDYAMGREFSHYNLLTQRMVNPLDHQSETGSGLFLGRIKNPVAPYFITREALFSADLLRIGFEGEPFHDIQRVTRSVPKKGKFYLKKNKGKQIKKGTPVYLIDRREGILSDAFVSLEKELSAIDTPSVQPVVKPFQFPHLAQHQQRQVTSKKSGNRNASKNKSDTRLMLLFRGKNKPRQRSGDMGTWISTHNYRIYHSKQDWLWLDPLIFPGEEPLCRDYISKALKKGARKFVLNSPWQISLFDTPRKLNIWAGPFCNITNSLTLFQLKRLGFSGAIVSPELDKKTYLSIASRSCMPIGAVIKGNWPLGISRIISPDLKLGLPFTSPKGETAWVSKFGSNYFIYPNWLFDISEKKAELEKAGFSLFVEIHENVPKTVSMKKRPGLWNWNLNLI